MNLQNANEAVRTVPVYPLPPPAAPPPEYLNITPIIPMRWLDGPEYDRLVNITLNKSEKYELVCIGGVESFEDFCALTQLDVWNLSCLRLAKRNRICAFLSLYGS